MKIKKILTIMIGILVISLVAIGIISVSTPTIEAEMSTTGLDGVRLSMPTVYGNHMVFQRGKDINVRGFCDKDGEVITVTLGDATATATVTDGEWFATIEPMEATFNLTLTVSRDYDGGVSTLTFTDVSVGEIVLVSGQSNASLQAYHLDDIDEHMDLIENYDNLRLYTCVPSLSLYESQYGTGSWHLARREIVVGGADGASRRFSAVGLVVGMRLAEELGPDVPVAVMTAARGASKIRAWLSYDNLAIMSPSEAERVDAEREYYEANGKYNNSETLHTQYGTSCYNTMIAPLRGFNVGSVLWYQGEGDSRAECFGTEGNGYTNYFATMTSGFREILGGDDTLPFFMIQIASYSLESASQDMIYNFKVEQLEIAEEQENVYLVPIMTEECTFTTKDAIASMFIHPVRKSPVGNRAANIILDELYGITTEEYCGIPNAVSISPSVASSTKPGFYEVTITFDSDITTIYGEVAEGFQLYNKTQKKWLDATGEILASGNQIKFTTSYKAYGARYGYGKPIVELESGERFSLASYTAHYTNSDKKETYTGVTLKDTEGNTYEITAEQANSGFIIKMITPGNIASTAGMPCPIFKIMN